MRLRHVPDFATPTAVTPRVRKVQFGDGYDQRTGDGVNTMQGRLQARFANRTKAVRDELIAFFRAHRGAGAFDMSMPDQTWAATDSGFGVGTGSRTQYQLLRQEMTTRRDDWQGEWPAYTKPRTNYFPSTNDLITMFSNTQGGAGTAVVKTANAGIAPDGTMTALRVEMDKGAVNANTEFSGITRAATLNDPARRGCFSVWLRTADGSTKRVSVEAASGLSQQIVTVTPQWQRFSATVTGVGTRSGFVRLRWYSASSFTDNQASLFVWGPQYEYDVSEPTRYVPNPTSSNTTEAPTYDAANGFVPATGFTVIPTLYTDGSWHGKYKLSPDQRSNLFQYSEDWTQAIWTKGNTTVTANAIAAPDGTVTADKVLINTAIAVPHYVKQSYGSTSTNQLYTFSCFVKAAEWTKIYIEFSTKAGLLPNVTFDLALGTVIANSGTTNGGTITSYGNGWYRVTVTHNVGSGGSNAGAAIMAYDGSTVAVTGDGVGGFYTWGSQFELGAVATPYIPTTSAVVTVTDYTLTDSGILNLATAPAAGEVLSFDGVGEVVKRVVAESWTDAPTGFNNYDISAELREVAA